MPGTYVYTLEIWPPLAIALAVALLGLYSWRQRAVPGARYFAIACSFWSLSLLALTAETAAANPVIQIIYHVLQAILQLPIVTAITCFTLAYVQPGRWLTRRNLLLLAMPPLLAALLMLTNAMHHLIWRELSVDTVVRATPAAGGWIALAYAIVLALIQAAALLWLFVHSPQHRWPVALMLSALVVARSIFVLTIFYPNLTAPLDSAFVLTLFPVLAYAVALFGFRLFDPLPTARQVVLEQVDAGVVVFDAQRRVVRLNPAAEQMVGVHSAAARGMSWQELTASATAPSLLTDDALSCCDPAASAPELVLGRGDATRRYAPLCLPLHDFRGLPIGFLLMFNDVTAAHQAQVQIVEQQRLLAALHERESFARDLHDSTGQVLGYASFQVEATRALLDAGQTTVAAAQLDRLAAVLQEAHADVREQILRLRASAAPQQPFAAALRQYLDGFSSNYAIGANLTIAPDLGVAQLAPESQNQLLRIVQEVLSNTRKHSGARVVTVSVAAAADTLSLRIADDGCGFELGAPSHGNHLGLHTMAERAAALGGSLHIESAPGAGTRVCVEVPWKER